MKKSFAFKDVEGIRSKKPHRKIRSRQIKNINKKYLIQFSWKYVHGFIQSKRRDSHQLKEEHCKNNKQTKKGRQRRMIMHVRSMNHGNGEWKRDNIAIPSL